MPGASDLPQAQRLNALYVELLERLHDPAVRDLAWLLSAPALLRAEPGLATQMQWDAAQLDAIRAWLLDLDNAPGALHAELQRSPQKRLGHYAEQLLGYFLTHGPVGRLIVANLPVRRGNLTLGECDFLWHAADGAHVHWELAVKCYLHVGPGWRNGSALEATVVSPAPADASLELASVPPEPASVSFEPANVPFATPGASPEPPSVSTKPPDVAGAPGDRLAKPGHAPSDAASTSHETIGALFSERAAYAELACYVGPDLTDRFDRKLRHMLGHQLPLSRRPEFAARVDGGPWRAELVLKGWLFYPLAHATLAGAQQLEPQHLRGWWATRETWLARRAQLQAHGWRVLSRRAWMAPQHAGPGSPAVGAAQILGDAALDVLLQQQFPPAGPRDETPDAVLAPDAGSTLAGPRSTRASPILVVAMRHNGVVWEEVSRGFIVERTWQARALAFAATDLEAVAR
jgi:hypothetical protein